MLGNFSTVHWTTEHMDELPLVKRKRTTILTKTLEKIESLFKLDVSGPMPKRHALAEKLFMNKPINESEDRSSSNSNQSSHFFHLGIWWLTNISMT